MRFRAKNWSRPSQDLRATLVRHGTRRPFYRWYAGTPEPQPGKAAALVRAAHGPRLHGFAAAGILGGSNHAPTPALLTVVVDMTSQEDTERVFLEFCRGTLSEHPLF